MSKIIFSFPNSIEFSKLVAKKSKIPCSELRISRFPDGETYLRFMENVKDKEIFLIQNLMPNPDRAIIQLLLALHTAKDLGAKKVSIFIPYMAYMRQDKRFHSGEAISSKIISKLFKEADFIATIDPHLHRYKSLSEIFKNKTKRLDATYLLSKKIKKHFSRSLLVGPDMESIQWVKEVSKQTGFPFVILKKKRISSRKVVVKSSNFNFKNKKIVLIDDVISSGHTILEAIKLLKKKRVASISIICIHGIFAEGSFTRIRKTGVKEIIQTNSIPSKRSSIDVSELFSNLI